MSSFDHATAEGLDERRHAMQLAWQEVEKHFDAAHIFGAQGAQFLKCHAVRASVHELCVAMTLLAGMAPLANGATMDIFRGTSRH